MWENAMSRNSGIGQQPDPAGQLFIGPKKKREMSVGVPDTTAISELGQEGSEDV